MGAVNVLFLDLVQKYQRSALGILPKRSADIRLNYERIKTNKLYPIFGKISKPMPIKRIFSAGG